MSVHILSTGGYEPYWGEQTSIMNFCEEDYHVTSYIGEFVNTLTSFSYIYLGGYALYRQYEIGDKAEVSHALSYISLIIVGVGSAVFHASLKYPLQLVDDLSMLFGAGIMSHYVLTIHSSPRTRFNLFVLIAVVLSLGSWMHVQLHDSTLHQVVFGVMVVAVGFKTFAHINSLVPDRALRSKLKKLGKTGYLTLISAYVLWLIDVFACSSLRSVRHAVGLPLAWLFELHGWWHILTSVGVYIYMIIGEYLRPEHRTHVLQPGEGWIDILRGPGLSRTSSTSTGGMKKDL